MNPWPFFLLFALGSGTVSNNGQTVQDEDYEKAVATCAMAVFTQALRDGADPMQHGQKYDEAREKCRRAIGGLMEH